MQLVAGFQQDIRFSIRMLFKALPFSIPVLFVLTLGIGSATTLYAIVYAMWLRPLPYPDADRLVSVMTYFPGYQIEALASPDYGIRIRWVRWRPTA